MRVPIALEIGAHGTGRLLAQPPLALIRARGIRREKGAFLLVSFFLQCHVIHHLVITQTTGKTPCFSAKFFQKIFEPRRTDRSPPLHALQKRPEQGAAPFPAPRAEVGFAERSERRGSTFTGRRRPRPAPGPYNSGRSPESTPPGRTRRAYRSARAGFGARSPAVPARSTPHS